MSRSEHVPSSEFRVPGRSFPFPDRFGFHCLDFPLSSFLFPHSRLTTHDSRLKKRSAGRLRPDSSPTTSIHLSGTSPNVRAISPAAASPLGLCGFTHGTASWSATTVPRVAGTATVPCRRGRSGCDDIIPERSISAGIGPLNRAVRNAIFDLRSTRGMEPPDYIWCRTIQTAKAARSLGGALTTSTAIMR